MCGFQISAVEINNGCSWIYEKPVNMDIFWQIRLLRLIQWLLCVNNFVLKLFLGMTDLTGLYQNDRYLKAISCGFLSQYSWCKSLLSAVFFSQLPSLLLFKYNLIFQLVSSFFYMDRSRSGHEGRQYLSIEVSELRIMSLSYTEGR